MQKLEKILKGIENLHTKILNDGFACKVTEQEIMALVNAKDIILKHTNDGWILCSERMPTKEECKRNKKEYIKFWITYGSVDNYSTLLANCRWVESNNEDGKSEDFAEFWIDQYPQIFYPSSNLVRAWKIIEMPEPYRPERSDGK